MNATMTNQQPATRTQKREAPPSRAPVALVGLRRSFASVFRMHFKPPVAFTSSKQGLESVEEWCLPHGTLRRVRISEPWQQALGMNSHLRDYPVNNASELKLFNELMRHVRFEADTGFQNYFAAERAIGDNGVVILGHCRYGKRNDQSPHHVMNTGISMYRQEG